MILRDVIGDKVIMTAIGSFNESGLYGTTVYIITDVGLDWLSEIDKQTEAQAKRYHKRKVALALQPEEIEVLKK